MSGELEVELNPQGTLAEWIRASSMVLSEIAPGHSVEEVVQRTEAPLEVASEVKTIVV